MIVDTAPTQTWGFFILIGFIMAYVCKFCEDGNLPPSGIRPTLSFSENKLTYVCAFHGPLLMRDSDGSNVVEWPELDANIPPE